tara:strand:- start:605 stop:1480 length:876 start_codon:yes stop_codon:yes gene_type:complete
MAVTELVDVQNQVRTFWSDLFMPELRESNPLLALVDKRYAGEIRKSGDTVRVSQVTKAVGETLTIGAAGDDCFTPEKLATAFVDIKADRRFVASYEFEDLVDLQSQIHAERSEIRESLLDAMNTQINNYLYSLIAPVAGQALTGVTAIDAATLKQVRVIAGKQKWMKNPGWYGLLSPDYYGCLLDDVKLVSSDYINDQPTVGGEIVTKRYGFNIIEDNSDGLASVSPTPGGPSAIFFHPAFMHMVTQMSARFKVSDRHSNNCFGFILSVDLIGGAKLGIEGDKMHISVVDA